MSSAAPIRHIDLGEDFGEVEVTANGSRVTIHSDGRVDAEARTPNRSPRVGERMSDGTIYAGISPNTGEGMYTTPADAPRMNWVVAMDHAAKLDRHGHKDWRLPTRAEVHVLYQNRWKGALKNTFNNSGAFASGWYWSGAENANYPTLAWMERFRVGGQDWYWKGSIASVRPVRSGP